MPPKKNQSKTGTKANPKASTSQSSHAKAKKSVPKKPEEKTVAPSSPKEGHSTDSDSSVDSQNNDHDYNDDQHEKDSLTSHEFDFSEDSEKDFPGETRAETRVRKSRNKRILEEKEAQKAGTNTSLINSKFFFITMTNKFYFRKPIFIQYSLY